MKKHFLKLALLLSITTLAACTTAKPSSSISSPSNENSITDSASESSIDSILSEASNNSKDSLASHSSEQIYYEKYYVTPEYWQNNIINHGYFGKDSNVTFTLDVTTNNVTYLNQTIENDNGKWHVYTDSNGEKEECYLVKNDDETYLSYTYSNDWNITTLSGETSYLATCYLDNLFPTFEFNNFSFDKETISYRSDKIELNSTTYKNISIQFEGGKLIKASYDIEMGGDSYEYVVTSSNWGSTVVQLPEIKEEQEQTNYDFIMEFQTTGSNQIRNMMPNMRPISGEYASYFDSDTLGSLYANDGGIRLAFASGFYSSDGHYDIYFKEALIIEKVAIVAKSDSNNKTATIGFDNNETVILEFVVNEKAEYVLTLTDNDLEETKHVSFYLDPDKTQGTVGPTIYSISFKFKTPSPYPSSIVVSPNLEIGVNGSRAIATSLYPIKTTIRDISYAVEDPSIALVDENGIVTGISIGETKVTTTVQGEEGVLTGETKIKVVEERELTKVKLNYTYKDVFANSADEVDCSPSVGNVKFLVIPVWFNDSTNFINSSKKEAVREDIRLAFTGTNTDVGWYSVKTFYEEESKGLLTFNATVSSWYNFNKDFEYLYKHSYNATPASDLVVSAVDWYFSNNPEDSRKNYDYDHDGYLDGVAVVYAGPDYISWGKTTYSSTNYYDELWPYCYWVAEEDERNVNNPGTNAYLISPYTVLYDEDTAMTKTGKTSYAMGNCENVKIDTHTLIHETGHLFGLDDYYDYGSHQYDYAGGFSMQDYNVGGHDPFSILSLGWANPYIPEKSCEITIGTFQKTHDLILLSNGFNEYNSPFDEYLLIELYSPTGVNEMDSKYEYHDDYPVGPDAIGIRLWHVDARLIYVEELNDSGYAVLKETNTTTNPNHEAEYGVLSLATNTFDGTNSSYLSAENPYYDHYNLLHLIRNDTDAPYDTEEHLSEFDLFRDGDEFNFESFSSQFYNDGRFNNDTICTWSFKVKINGTGENTTATITLTRNQTNIL